MKGPRAAAHDPYVLMEEASSWRDTLSHDPDGTVPLLVAWTAWRWADAARRLAGDGGRRHNTIAVVTLLAHARMLLDLLDAGHVESALSLHAGATQGDDILTQELAEVSEAFRHWRVGGRDAGRAPVPRMMARIWRHDGR